MKKTAIKKLKSVCDIPLSNVSYSDIMDVLHNVCPQGERFKSPCMCDRDWWYIVSYTNDMDKHGRIVPLVLVKSYSMNKRRWIYKCLHCGELYHMLCLTVKTLEENEEM